MAIIKDCFRDREQTDQVQDAWNRTLSGENTGSFQINAKSMNYIHLLHHRLELERPNPVGKHTASKNVSREIDHAPNSNGCKINKTNTLAGFISTMPAVKLGREKAEVESREPLY